VVEGGGAAGWSRRPSPFFIPGRRTEPMISKLLKACGVSLFVAAAGACVWSLSGILLSLMAESRIGIYGELIELGVHPARAERLCWILAAWPLLIPTAYHLIRMHYLKQELAEYRDDRRRASLMLEDFDCWMPHVKKGRSATATDAVVAFLTALNNGCVWRLTLYRALAKYHTDSSARAHFAAKAGSLAAMMQEYKGSWPMAGLIAPDPACDELGPDKSVTPEVVEVDGPPSE